MGNLSPAEMSAILQLPLQKPPQGVTSNFINPHFHGQSIIVLAVICLSWLIALGCLRAYVKARITRMITPDDNVYCVSWSAGVTWICLVLAMDTSGTYGYHAWDIKIGAFTKSILIRGIVLQVLYGPSCWLIRLSLFAMIYFAFAPHWWTKRMVVGGVVVSGLVYLTPTPVAAVLCRPRGGTDQIAYLAGQATEQCANSRGVIPVMDIAIGVWNIVVDLYLLALPIPAIRRLMVNRRQKIAIYAVFGTAVIGCLVGCLALVFRIRIYGAHDLTYTTIPLNDVWIVEMTISLTIPCAGSFYALWKHYHQRPRSMQPSQVAQTADRGHYGRHNDNEKAVDMAHEHPSSLPSIEES